MTADKGSTDLTGTTTGDATGRELARQYWATMARTADLVRTLTALADRYDAAISAGDRHAVERRTSVELMRTTAESGRRLIRSLAPPAPPLEERPAASPLERADRARSRDVRASRRDAAAEARDERATERDARLRSVTGDADADFAGRFLAACDRDAAAGDRGDALADRRAAQADRDQQASPPAPDLDSQARTYALVTRLQGRVVVRQAQGILMARAGLSAGEAFEALLLAAGGSMTLDGVADHVVRQGELPAVQDAT